MQLKIIFLSVSFAFRLKILIKLLYHVVSHFLEKTVKQKKKKKN